MVLDELLTYALVHQQYFAKYPKRLLNEDIADHFDHQSSVKPLRLGEQNSIYYQCVRQSRPCTRRLATR